MVEFRQLSIRESVVSSLSKVDRGLGKNQTQNRPKPEYGPDETDRCLGIGQTKHTQFRYGPDRTDPISVWARRSGATENLSRL